MVRLSLFQYPVHLERSFSNGYSLSLGPVVFLGAERPIVKSSYAQTRLRLYGAVFLVLILLRLLFVISVDQHHLHINVKEALVLANALDAFSSSFRDSWLDVYTDSQVLIASWRRQGSKSRDLADVFKRILGIVSTYNIHLNLF